MHGSVVNISSIEICHSLYISISIYLYYAFDFFEYAR